MKWISVDEAFPEYDCEVVVCLTNKEATCAYFVKKYPFWDEHGDVSYLSNGWCLCSETGSYLPTNSVNHWMPLPAPPDTSGDSNR